MEANLYADLKGFKKGLEITIDWFKEKENLKLYKPETHLIYELKRTSREYFFANKKVTGPYSKANPIALHEPDFKKTKASEYIQIVLIMVG